MQAGESSPVAVANCALEFTAAELELQGKVCEALRQNPHLAGRKLRFETAAGRVVLKGTVNSFYQKQMAQEALRRLAGVAQIDNQLHVDWTPNAQQSKPGQSERRFASR